MCARLVSVPGHRLPFFLARDEAGPGWAADWMMSSEGEGRLGLLLTLLLVELALLFGGGILVLLVLRDQVVHVALSLSELHLIHTLTSVPMEESLAPEHSCEL